MDQKGIEFAITDAALNMSMRIREHNCIAVSVSGGADSDLIVHMIATQFREFLPKIHFVFSDTGIEYRATLDHLDYLEKKYGITIERIKGMPIPVAVKKYGIPFLSKQVSEYMGRLQSHGFSWVPGGLNVLEGMFPKTRAALRWWCNEWGEKSRFNINWNHWLKEFLLEAPPDFKVSAMCCQKSKKEPLIRYQKEIGADLSITGERKSEGGARARKNGCFERSHGIDHYMPLFWWDDDTKHFYEKQEDIRHSDCYEVYGLKRTGCVGCPFALNRKEELEVMQKFEPKLYKACMFVFGESYQFMDRYDKFREGKK